MTSSTTPRRILILGGTSWLGGAMARIARDSGHDVTCLARGESGQVPDGVRLLPADRWKEGAYDAVADQDWDAVLDVSRQPEQVRSALAALAGRTTHWVYVSSVSAYRDHSAVGSTQTHEPWAGTGAASEEDYGPAKVACEDACAEALPADRLLVARAGLIVGYGDRSDRFGYWPARLDAADSPDTAVLVPPLATPVQVVDVEDLAGWLVSAATAGTAGTFDAVGEVITLEDVLAVSCDATGQRPTLCVADQEWLLTHDVEAWSGPDSLPLWLPLPEYAAMATHPNEPATRAGLTLRPLRETAAAALAWERGQGGLDRSRKAGMSPGRETELLAALRERPTA